MQHLSKLANGISNIGTALLTICTTHGSSRDQTQGPYILIQYTNHQITKVLQETPEIKIK
jgi:hypothetical protein